MGSSEAKIIIEKELLNVQLNLENNYKETAYDAYLGVSAMVESFYDQGEISRWAYNRFKKKLKSYDKLYEKETDEKLHTVESSL